MSSATTKRKSRTRRRLLTAGAILAGGAVAIYIAAEANMAHERAARQYLGNLLYTEIRGEGDPIVFIPGLQASTRYWGNAFDGLAREHRLIFLDSLGFGRSPWPERLAYDLDDQLAALRRTLVAKQATQRVTIVAHSFGTIIAANYAARYPSEVERIVLLGAPVYANEQEARQRIKRMSSLAALFAFNDTLANISCMTMCAFRPLLQRFLPPLRPELAPAVVSDSVLHDLPAVNGAVNRILLRVPIEKALHVVGAKTVLIHGANDTVTPLPNVRRLAAQTGARLVEVGGNHHEYFSDGIDKIHAAVHSQPTPSVRGSGTTTRRSKTEETEKEKL